VESSSLSVWSVFDNIQGDHPGFKKKKVGLARGVALQKQQTGALLNFTWIRKLGDSARKIGKTWKTEFASTLWKVDRAIENNPILTHL